MDYKVEFEHVCRKIASTGLNGPELQRLHSLGSVLLKEDAEAAKNAPSAPPQTQEEIDAAAAAALGEAPATSAPKKGQ